MKTISSKIMMITPRRCFAATSSSSRAIFLVCFFLPLLSCLLHQVSSFLVHHHHPEKRQHLPIIFVDSRGSSRKTSSNRRRQPKQSFQVLKSLSSKSDGDDSIDGDGDGDSQQQPKIPQLPVPGSSSFHQSELSSTKDAASTTTTTTSTTINNTTDTAFVSRKFELQYTCNICETRNCVMISRLAYREGVVVATCKGCNSKHLIADNLGMGTAGFDGEGATNIEEYFENASAAAANIARNKTEGLDDDDEDDDNNQQVVNRVGRDVFDLEKVLNLNTRGGSLVDDDGNPVLE